MAQEIASLFVRIGADIKGFEEGLASVGASLSAFGGALGNLGRGMTLGITLPLAAVSVAAAKTAIDLDASMRNIQSISKESDTSLMALRDTFLDMSTDMSVTTASANELAEGFYQIQSSGFAGADAMTVLEASAQAGSAGLSTTAVAATALTAALNAYGEGADQASHYADIMFKSVDIGVMSFEELATSLSNVISTAAATGVSFETVGAAMTTMTKQGMSAAEASVSLNQILTSLLKPSTELANALAEIGFESGQAALDALGLDGVLRALADAGYDSSEGLAGLFNNVRALRGVLSLSADGFKMFTDDMETFKDVNGATAEAFAIQMQSMKAQMDNLKNSATALGIELFDVAAPAFRDILDGAKGLVDKLRELDPAMQETIVKWGAIAMAAGPVAIGMSKIATAVGSLFGMIGLSGVFSSFAGTLAGLLPVLGPIAAGLLTIASAALIANNALGAVNDINMDDSTQGWNDFFKTMSTQGASATEFAQAFNKQWQDTNQTMLDSYPAISGLIDAEKMLYDAREDAAQTILELSDNYIEYSNAMDMAGLSALAMNQYTYDTLMSSGELRDNFRELFNAGEAASLATDDVANSNRGLADSYEELEDTTDTAMNVIDAATSTLSAYGMSADQIAAAQTTLAGAFGVTLPEIDKQAQTIDLLTQAYTEGLIGVDYWAQALVDATTGVSTLNAAQIMAIETALQYSATLASATEISKNHALQQASLASQLMDATPAQVASTAIDMLSNQLEAGNISWSEYSAAVSEAQLNYGLASESSMALAAGLTGLDTAIASGVINVSDWNAALGDLVEGATLDQLIDKYGTMAESMDEIDGSKVNETIADIQQSIEDSYGSTKDFEDMLTQVGTLMGDLDGLSAKVDISTNAEAAATAIGAVGSAVLALPSGKTITITVVTNYVGGAPPTGGGSWGGPAPSGQEGGALSLLNTSSMLPTGTLSVSPTATTLSAAPTIVSQDTYNINNPLAAAIILDQKHKDNLASAELALTR